MEIINNIDKRLIDDLKLEIKKDSKLSIAAAYFSIFAYEELRKELQDIDSLKFIFTSPTFVTEKAKKERKEFYIPRSNREKSLIGADFEVKLRNELNQKAIAKECAEWIRKKVEFRSNRTNETMIGFMNVDSSVYTPINGFTTAELGCEKGDNAYTMIMKSPAPFSTEYINLFNTLWNNQEKLEDVTDTVLDSITAAYSENSPEFIYFVTLYNIFNEFLDDISEDTLPNEATGFKNSKIWNMLYSFQKDAALGIINKLEKYNGCILADSVGLGKTFTALAVIKYYENRNKTVLVLCPKKLGDNWITYKGNYKNNPIAEDRLRYDVLYHTDLSREHGYSNGIDLARLNWDNYDLVVIDESHNFRNGGQITNNKENRYLKLLNNVIRPGVKTKVLMLSATPVNTKLTDLKNQLQLAYEGDATAFNQKLNVSKSIDDIFTNAQKAFNKWSKGPVEERTTENLLKMLDFDFFEVLDSVTIARSRKHIQKYYNTKDIGDFPKRLTPISARPKLTDISDAISYDEIYEILIQLNLSIYTPSSFILASKVKKYEDLYGDNKVNVGFTQANRELGIRYLMAVNLMKRMESSVHSFRLTLERIINHIKSTLSAISQYSIRKEQTFVDLVEYEDPASDFDSDDENTADSFCVGKKVRINLQDMDLISWKRDLEEDIDNLQIIDAMVKDITPEHDLKLRKLWDIISNKIRKPINDGNKKVIVFTAFADTAEYLYENISPWLKEEFSMDTAMITGSIEGRTTIKGLKTDLNTVLTYFSPISKNKLQLVGDDPRELDLLIATDCISEGQNLQDCDYLINYDIHWNPVRIIQRFGRVDRIGSRNKVIQLVNFWPDITLDSYIKLKSRVETRMKIVNITATGSDNVLTEEENQELEYRKAQLKKLQEEVVDIEDMSSGISIMDLGLNDFRMDLLEYVKHHPEIEKAPFGLNAVAPSSEDAPEGVIYVLKNRTDSVNIDQQNRLHPFYLVYLDMEGNIICDHLQPKALLDKLRFACKGKNEPIASVYQAFNKETRDGRNMSRYSELLSDAISSIISVKELSDVDSFLSGGQMSFFNNEIKGLDDFELICFLVLRRENTEC